MLTLVDTAGAYPGIGAEERGQAEAIARSTDRCLSLGVPMVAVVIGEGGSGGAVAIATANRVLMLEHSIYTVASPEARGLDPVARLGARHRRRHQHEDHRPGPRDARHHRRGHRRAVGGAHRDPALVFRRTGDAVDKAFAEFSGLSPDALRRQRADKYLAIGRKL